MCLLLLSLPLAAGAQFGFRGPQQEDLMPRFDTDRNGRLEGQERVAAREYARNRPGSRATTGNLAPRAPAQGTEVAASLRAAAPAGTGLYDADLLRTLYLRFPGADWYPELTDFYGTGVEVAADLVVDGKLYPQVGVHFRGNSSFLTTGDSPKKSLGLSLDYRDPEQRLLGYRTLNLMNAHADPSFVREALYYTVARVYVPAPRASFVRLLINGESWGVYVNVQQVNNDFLRESYGETGGVRWKVPAGRGGGAGLTYRGSDPSAYTSSYEIQSTDNPEAWAALVRFVSVLDQAPVSRDRARLEAVLDVDEALWYLALENIFTDSDGYLSRGSDFMMYQDRGGRFHLLPHDNNETFRYAGGGGPNSWPTGDPMLSPTVFEGSTARPLVNALLSFPELRARYLAHLRTIVEEHLDWGVLGPVVTAYQRLIDDAVRADDKKLYGYDAFQASAGTGSSGGGFGGGSPGLRAYVETRRAYLLSHPELAGTPVVLADLVTLDLPTAAVPMRVTVRAMTSVPGKLTMRLYWSPEANTTYRSALLADDGAHGDGAAGDGVWGGLIPAHPAGTVVRYYVEALRGEAKLVASYEPRRAEVSPAWYRVPAVRVDPGPVVINEIMASNSSTVRDPQGGFDDWIELHNTGTRPIDLAGMYLSDRFEDPRQWVFPPSTVIPPGGYLVVWADEDTADSPGLHASFQLSAAGERVLLVDTDARGNGILDQVEYGAQREGVSLVRAPDATFRTGKPTPGAANP